MTKRTTPRPEGPGVRPHATPRGVHVTTDAERTPTPEVAAEIFEAATTPGTAVLTVGPDEPAEHLFRRLLGAYLAGAPEFVIHQRPTLTPGTREVVRTFCRRIRQPEIVSEERATVRLHDLSFESPVSLEQRVQRMGRLVVTIHKEAIDGWSHLPLGDDSYWDRKDDEVDREAWYIQRIATLRLGTECRASEILGSWTVARSLERIADHAIIIGATGPRLAALPQGQGPTTPLRQFHAQAMDHLEGALAARDGDRANDLLDTGHALIESGHALADRLLPGVGGGVMPPATAAAVARILESIQRTIAYAQDIAQVALDRSIPVLTPETPSGGPSAGRRERFLPAAAR